MRYSKAPAGAITLAQDQEGKFPKKAHIGTQGSTLSIFQIDGELSRRQVTRVCLFGIVAAAK
jgi:hypothetical protein